MSTDLEIIHSSQDEAKEIELTNGDKVMIHKERAYDDFYLEGKSFDDVAEGNSLQFDFSVKLHRDGLTKMKEAGNTIRSNPMMVHHSHVSWIYAMGVSLLVGDDKPCELVVTSVGPSFKQKDSVAKGAFGNNCHSLQTAPSAAVSCALIFHRDGQKYSVEMERQGDGFKSKTSLTLNQLIEAMGEETTALVKLSLTVDRSYFSLKTLMNPNLETVNVVPQAAKLLTTVLKGEKPTGWDWVVTVGEGSPREFFVHGKVLAHSSPLLEAAMKTHNSLGQEHVLMVSHENRFILPKIHADDMPVILSYFYVRTFVLPKYDAFARVGRVLCALLPQYGIANFFLYWESAIIKDTMSFDKKNYTKTLPACARHLVSVYSSPYGAMPAAKKVLVSTMADCWHMAETQGINVEEELKDEAVFSCTLLENAMNSVLRFKAVAAAAQKIAL